ncbi:hypothetical protein ACP4OV_022069 [Aristida adscensionis]
MAPPHVVEDCLRALRLLSDGTVIRSDAAVLSRGPGRPVEGRRKLPVLVYFHGGGFCSFGAFEQRRRRGRPVLAAHRRRAVAREIGRSHPCLRVRRVGRRRHGPPRRGPVRLGPSRRPRARAGARCRMRASRGVLRRSWTHGDGGTATHAGVSFTTEMSDQFWRLSLPVGATRDNPAANPSRPPVLVVAAGRDLLRDRVLGYAESLKATGKAVELPDIAGDEHGFFVLRPWGDGRGGHRADQSHEAVYSLYSRWYPVQLIILV